MISKPFLRLKSKVNEKTTRHIFSNNLNLQALSVYFLANLYLHSKSVKIFLFYVRKIFFLNSPSQN
jgi:hypothetical protein